MQETTSQRARRIIQSLKQKYPGKKAFDLDGEENQFVCEIEPTEDHPQYDRAIEVIIGSKPHKHLKMTQYYTVISGNLELYVGDKIINLKSGDKHTVKPNNVHFAKSNDEAWVGIYSKPGWTKEDHIPVN